MPNSTLSNVPRLRFPGFEGEWEARLLGDIAEISKGVGISKEQRSLEGNPCILYGELYTTYSTEIIDDVVSKTHLPTTGLVQSKPNDIVIPASGETAIDISTARCVTREGVFLGGDLNIIRLRGQDGRFFSYQLNGARKKDIAKVAQGVSIVHLHGNDLAHIKVYYPSQLEQEKIASLLSLIDQRISIQNKTIEDLKKLKSALCRIIFKQPPLRYIALCDLIVKGKAGGTPRSTNKDYYNGNIPFLSINDISKQGKYVTYTDNNISEKGLRESSAWLVPAGSLILSMYASVGLPTINKITLATSQAMFSMILKMPELIDYLYYYLCYFKDKFIYRYLETGTQSNINSEIVKSLKIPDYGIANIKFGRILSVVDERIKNEEQVVAKLQCQKSYLLRSLFI